MSEVEPCAICGKPVVPDLRPFCSKRCADIDLQRWLTGRYAVPTRDDDQDAGEGTIPGQPDEG